MKRDYHQISLALFALLCITLVGCPAIESERQTPSTGTTTPASTDSPAATADEEAIAPVATSDATELDSSEMPPLTPPESNPQAAVATPQPAYGEDAVVPCPFKTPVAMLTEQIDYYVDRLGDSTESEEDYMEDYVDRVRRDAGTVKVLATALGLAQEDSAYKKSAGALFKAADFIVNAKTHADAKKGAAVLAIVLSEKRTDPTELKWGPIASLEDMMSQVPLVESRMKRGVRRFESKSEDIGGYASTLAMIAQASFYDTQKTKDAAQVKLWQKHCMEMRDASLEIVEACEKKDEAQAKKAIDTLSTSCKECHKTFAPDEV